MNIKYIIYILRNIIILILVIGTLNNALAQIGFDGLEHFKNVLGINVCLHNKLYLLCGLCILVLIIDKYFWLPFLGESLFPPLLINETNPSGDTVITVQVHPNNKVAYWVALPNSNNNIDVTNAYDKYQNSGVVRADNDGNAKLIFNKGSGYVIPSGSHLKPHVHYREIHEKTAMLGPIKTYFL
jgi:hypothetical protein